jgi:hypothetical protein
VRSTFSRGALVALLAVALAVPAAARAAAPQSQSATLGAVTATLTYTPRADGLFKNVHLKIVRGGQQLLDQDTGKLCVLCDGAGPLGDSAVHVANLDGAANPEPEVYTDLWTGGLHCCTELAVFRLSDDGTHYESLVRDFGDAGDRFADIDHDGIPEILSQDPRFSERFVAFVVSGAPVQILDYDHGALRDVTRRFPARVRSDLHQWRKLIDRQKRHRDGELRGIVAPYVADECLLGRCATGLRFATKLERGGYFSGRHALGGLHGAAYVRALKRLLKSGGYD